eukprot:TRINITY_DN69905_c0_g1_i1.p2 TRINITY_DN69905_c0_g1~~TRINITY_DN69905_c0_g1_i1.p2  ORF type:complete len:181 (-),score=17.31 TRINITY_DN69905_c0_g1_i1:133-675(-)
MRQLTVDESKQVFEKLAKYIGANTKYLLDRKDEPWVFRLHERRVWYMSKRMAGMCHTVARDCLVGAGICIGRFTHHGQFRVTIGALDILAQFCLYKVWVKPNQENAFLFGDNITRPGLGRITENTPQHVGAVVFNMADVPLGFGTTAQSTASCRTLIGSETVLFHEADVGEYLRKEDRVT